MQELFHHKRNIGAVDGLILAAGASSRMGRDKAAIEIHGRSFLEHCVAALAPQCRRIVIVLGYHAGAIEAALRPGIEMLPEAARLLWTRNPAPERGQFSSLQAGLQTLTDDRQAVVVCPVDHPLFQPATVAALLAAWREEAGAEIIKPAYQGKHGHPVLYGPGAVQALRQAPEEATAREVQTAFTGAMRTIEVDDPGIGWNLDTPEELARMAGAEKGSGQKR